MRLVSSLSIEIYIRYERIQHPTKTQGPAGRDIPSDIPPVEEHPRVRVLSRDDAREDDQNDGDAIVAELEEDDLGEDAQRG